jgi:hypothetical protein
MQTFLPYASYQESARVLDRQRLGKQRVEAWQILITLTGEGSQGWARHPAVRMWAGYEESLAAYGVAICSEWIGRGYRDSLLPRFTRYTADRGVLEPFWLGDKGFHQSHRSNLLRKLESHYRAFWPDDPSDLPYIWPK